MATLLQAGELAGDTVFRLRVRVAALKAAIDIAAEESADPARRQLAVALLANPIAYEDRFAWAVVTNPTVVDAGVDVPDGDVQFVVNSVWNALAAGM